MNKFDWGSHNVVGASIPPAAARNANFNGSGVDCGMAEGQMGAIFIGTNSASVVLSVEESDDDGATDAYTAVPAPAVFSAIGGQAPRTVPITAALSAHVLNFTRTKRWVRLVLTGSGHNLAGLVIGHDKYLA